jgi:hypothetical protein
MVVFPCATLVSSVCGGSLDHKTGSSRTRCLGRRPPARLFRYSTFFLVCERGGSTNLRLDATQR